MHIFFLKIKTHYAELAAVSHFASDIVIPGWSVLNNVKSGIVQPVRYCTTIDFLNLTVKILSLYMLNNIRINHVYFYVAQK